MTWLWKYSWLEYGYRPEDFALYNLWEGEDDAKVIEYIDGVGGWDGNRLSTLPTKLQLSPPGAGSDADQLVWGLTTNGVFTIKSAYSMIREADRPENKLWNLIWSWKNPAKSESKAMENEVNGLRAMPKMQIFGRISATHSDELPIYK